MWVQNMVLVYSGKIPESAEWIPVMCCLLYSRAPAVTLPGAPVVLGDPNNSPNLYPCCQDLSG